MVPPMKTTGDPPGPPRSWYRISPDAVPTNAPVRKGVRRSSVSRSLVRVRNPARTSASRRKIPRAMRAAQTSRRLTLIAPNTTAIVRRVQTVAGSKTGSVRKRMAFLLLGRTTVDAQHGAAVARSRVQREKPADLRARSS